MKFSSFRLSVVLLCCLGMTLPATVDAAEYRYGRLDPFPFSNATPVGLYSLGWI